ncbi:MAG: diguanylate cyclase [Gammaproteobacteria bacterium]|nr:MAG: diguanylate cyclase [Gammaproteobacteria bacterium]
MAALGLNHYNIRAPRELLEKLRDFYCETVGLRVGARPAFRSHGYWLYAGDRDVLHLTQTREGETREISVTPTFDHVAFTCENFASMHATLIAARIKHEVDAVPGNGPRQIFFRDPAGNGVELSFEAES